MFVNVTKPAKPGHFYACPCCGYKTLESRGGDEICPICYWDDDGQDSHDADEIRGGPNKQLSLSQARSNFKAFGASAKEHLSSVRRPTPEEHES